MKTYGEKDIYQIAKARERNCRDLDNVKCIKDESKKVIIDDDSIKKSNFFYKLCNEHFIDNVVWGLKTIKDWFTVLNQVRLKNFFNKKLKLGKSVDPNDIPIKVRRV